MFGLLGLGLIAGVSLGLGLGLGVAPDVGDGEGEGLALSCGAVNRNLFTVPEGTPEITFTVALDLSCWSICVGLK